MRYLHDEVEARQRAEEERREKKKEEEEIKKRKSAFVANWISISGALPVECAEKQAEILWDIKIRLENVENS